jgi:group II intron reverse transcriptase/maturase
MKPVNKSEGTDAESVERRPLAEGNELEHYTHRTQRRGSVSPGLERVRERAKHQKQERFTALLHHVDVERLRAAYWALKREAAPGIDGVTWRQYGEALQAHLDDLHGRLHRGAYRALPSRRQYIPKSDGRLRPLGMAALEDKLVQRALVEVLNAIYETDFVGFSYGFRPGRSQHDALDALATGITRTSVNWIVDADIASFFDSVSHEWLIRFVEHRIGDERVVRLIRKWLKAGVMEGEKLTVNEEGTPQGAVISPLLANIYLHYVFDLWAQAWRKRHATGAMIIVRYADDIVCGFEHEREARGFMADLRARLEQFALTLHAQKTRLIEFGRYAAERRERRGQGRPETFDFLGFTHICGRARSGALQLKRKTRRDRMRVKVKQIKASLRQRMHEALAVQGEWLSRVYQGYCRYHAVPTNKERLEAFRHELLMGWWRVLKRRSQRDRTPWVTMVRLAKRWLPSPRILHPWPDDRFLVKHPRWEPGARIAPAGICAGGVQ